MAGVIVNEFVDDFPSTTRPGSGNHTKSTTDTDVVLAQLKADFEATGVPKTMKFVDYNTDLDGNPVDPKTAKTRASGRVTPLKTRGYTVANGWVIASRNGALYAKYFGPGGVPAEYNKAVGEATVAA